MQKRYCKWFQEYLYDMTEKQEEYLISNGFSIITPELKKWDDGIIRDLPHRIKQDDDYVNLVFHDKKGTFYIQIHRKPCHSADEIKLVVDRLNYLSKIMLEVQKLGDI